MPSNLLIMEVCTCPALELDRDIVSNSSNDPISNTPFSFLLSQGILDFSQDLDVGLLDRVVNCLFSGGPDVSNDFSDFPSELRTILAIMIYFVS